MKATQQHASHSGRFDTLEPESISIQSRGLLDLRFFVEGEFLHGHFSQSLVPLRQAKSAFCGPLEFIYVQLGPRDCLAISSLALVALVNENRRCDPAESTDASHDIGLAAADVEVIGLVQFLEPGTLSSG